MTADTPLITDAAKVAARQTLANYSAGVFAHITGDWTHHNVVRVYSQKFSDVAGHADASDTLRILGDLTTADVAVAIPANPSGTSVLLTSPPIITIQPVSQIVTLGDTARFGVGVISDSAMGFQWYKAGIAIPGQTASQLVLPNIVATNAGTYWVVVTNVNGSIKSLSVTLTIGYARNPSGGDSFDLFDPSTWF